MCSSISSSEHFSQKVPTLLRVSKKDIFSLAASTLHLVVKSENTIQIMDDKFVTKLTITNMMARTSYTTDTQEFFGSMASLKNDAIENAYWAVLQHLENKNLIEVDDYNAKKFAQATSEILSSNSWAMLFEDKTKKLKQELALQKNTLQELLGKLVVLRQEISSTICCVAPSKPRKGTKKRPRQLQAGDDEDIGRFSTYCDFSATLRNIELELRALSQ